MKHRRKRLGHRGETLTETLVAIVIISLSSVLLASMVGAASRMNAAVLERDRVFYAELSQAERQLTPRASGTVTVRIGGEAVEFPVTVYGAGGLVSYALEGRDGD